MHCIAHVFPHKIKNKSQIRGKFLALRKEVFSVHENHAFHHNLTSKTPHSNNHFFPDPLKKHNKTAIAAPNPSWKKKPKKQ